MKEMRYAVLVCALSMVSVSCSDADTSSTGGEACKTQNDCPGGYCIFSDAGTYCSPCPPCDDGHRCNTTTGECEVVQTCGASFDCPLGQICTAGECVPGCDVDTKEGCCVSAAPASNDADASDGDAAIQDVLEDAITAPSRIQPLCDESLENLVCQEGKRCVMAGNCAANEDCPFGYECATSFQCTLIIIEEPPPDPVDAGPTPPCLCKEAGCDQDTCVECFKANDCGSPKDWQCQNNVCTAKNTP